MCGLEAKSVEENPAPPCKLPKVLDYCVSNNDEGARSSREVQSKTRKWKDIQFQKSENVLINDIAEQEWRQKKYAPVDIFQQFLDKSILDHMCRQTIIYAMQEVILLNVHLKIY